jgi:microcompartment protein CcmK/EutM
MLIGKVIGDVVATQKAPSHEGRKTWMARIVAK